MRNYIITVLTIISINIHAQVKSGGTYKEYFQEGSYLLLEDNFLMAKDNFEAAYQIDSSSANINYLLGVCYLKSLNEKYKAEYHLSYAVKNISKNYKNDQYVEKAAPPLAHYYYGDALNINYKFDEAIVQYNEFKKYVGADKDYGKMVAKSIASSEFAKTQYSNPINVQITNLGDSINGQYPDFSPVMSSDENMLIYTTRRPNTTGGIKDVFGYYNEDVVVSYKDMNGVWSSPKSISENINSGNMEASVNITADGQTLIVYKDDGTGGGNIYYSTYEGKDWSPLKEFGSDVNSKYWESHACLNKDQTVLYFTSNRPGGYGGKDLYRCVKLPNGKWSKAYNMGANINTPYDEDGAFIHPDGVTFFFASNGHKTMGGFDIMFTTIIDDNTFGEITNIGYPINTTDDDVFYISSVDGKRGYFSSAKDGGYGEKDIYMVSIPESKEKPLALFKGQIIPAPGETLPEDLMIVVKDKETGEIVGTYKPRLVNGVFSTILPPGKEYNFSYQAPQGEEFYNEDVFVTNELTYNEIKREVNLEPVKLLGKVAAKKKNIVLNTIVLNNSKQKSPIADADIIIQEVGGNAQTLKSDASGKYENIALEPEKKYTVFAEKEGKKSVIANISTIGVKAPKVFSQVIYMEGKPATVATGEQMLNVVVKDRKTGKIIPNANVVLEDNEGIKTNYTTDESGFVKDVAVALNTKYKLNASEGSNVSDLLAFTTPLKASKKTITKTIYLGIEQIAGTSTGNLPATRYEYFFKYNKNLNDETEEQWNTFIDKIIELSSKKRSVYITIRSSASYVPTRTFKNNKQLASTRAKNLQTKIKEAVAAKGGDIKKLRFSRKSKVGGPRYRGDHDLGRAKYEPHQYVKARVK